MTEEEKQKLLKKLLEDKEKIIAVKKKYNKEYESLPQKNKK